MREPQLFYLFEKLVNDKLNAEERNQFLSLISKEDNTEELNQLVQNFLENGRSHTHLDKETSQILLDSIFATGKIQMPETTPAKLSSLRVLQRFWWAAAVIILTLTVTGLLLNNKPNNLPAISAYKNDVSPGMVGAIIELSNGKRILLDTSGNGILRSLGTNAISKSGDGIVIDGNIGSTLEYVTVTTPLKRTQKIQLPDGSTIWLNAGSAIKFPIRFTGNKRLIEATGQIIAKVVHDEKNPFQISVRGQVFEDKGTEFDVNAYDEDQMIKFTVLEGAVVYKNIQAKAGEQIDANPTGINAKLNKLTEAKMDEVFSWRDGLFTYDHASIEMIMKQAAKWYDVEIIYEGQIDQSFTLINVDRKTPISTLLKSMELSGGVHFEIQGNKVIVKK